MITELTKQNFEEITKNGICLIDFWASWCGPCRMMSPIIDEIASERLDIRVCKVNTDKQDELAMSFGIVSIPTFVLIKDGVVAAQAVGYMQKDQLISELKL